MCFIDAPLGESRFPFKLARGLPKNLNLTDSFLINVTRFLYKQLHFPVEPRVATESAQNEPQSCYEVANVFCEFEAQMYGKSGKIGKMKESCYLF